MGIENLMNEAFAALRSYSRVVSTYVDALEGYERLLHRLVNDDSLPESVRVEIGQTLVNLTKKQGAAIAIMQTSLRSQELMS